MASPRSGRAYKEFTLQQLRSFCETARQGSFKAAADSLDLAHPTVWEQVHALERELGARLVEPHGRGCRLTEEGRLFVELAGPLMVGIDSLKRTFQEARARVEPRLTVATTSRTLVEDLSRPIVLFERLHPEVRVCFKEVSTEEVIEAVASGQADLGVSAQPPPRPTDPRLVFQPLYQLELILVTPRDHPLARRRRVTPDDLCDYPLVKADNFPDPAIQAQMNRLGLLETEPRRIEARYSATIRHYVGLGFGIGLVVGLPSRKPDRNLHERSLSRYFGRIAVHLVQRRGVLHSPFVKGFATIVRDQLKPK